MSLQNSDFYATQTGIAINPARAYPRIAGVDILFSAF